MELQFRNKEIHCLRRQNWDCREQEQTQELRISDGLPDIGRVICAWGQVVIRSKQWNSSGAEVSGGVMAWVMCKGEDTEEIFGVDSWIPFRMKLELPECDRDGTLLVSAVLKGVEARTLSARKLMIRTNLHIAADAVVPEKLVICEPDNEPENLCMLQKTKNVCLSVEAGEKPFAIEDTLEFPGLTVETKILRCCLVPEITEKRVVGGKGVFRGSAQLHVLYKSQEGQIAQQNYDLPFSQFAELERDYEDSAEMCVFPAVTGLEYDVSVDGGLELRANITVQYRIDDIITLSYMDDVYSTFCKTEPVKAKLCLSPVADVYAETVQPEIDSQIIGREVLDAALYISHPVTDDGLWVEGYFQVLYTDEEGAVQSVQIPWKKELGDTGSKRGKLLAVSAPVGQIRGNFSGGLSANGRVHIQAITLQEEQLEHIVQVRLGDPIEPDPDRPSLILLRNKDKSLWELAKGFGTTVEAIQSANGIEEETHLNQMLLIPIT